jgi:hypothetical protein
VRSLYLLQCIYTQHSTGIKEPEVEEQENKTEECSVVEETEETGKINLI